ncbi:hypothetical protein YQE_02690, partial [Dendroctonus ponderosae]
MRVQPVQWTFENIDNLNNENELSHLADFLSKKRFDLLINIPMRNGGARRVSSFMTHGYRTRRLAIDYSIPLITDVKCTKLLVEAIRLIGKAPPMKTHTDCMSSRNILKLPGFIDAHVHVREPGATHKEDYASCSAAALAGGVTLILAMPNTNPAIVDEEAFLQVKKLAKEGARCDYALFVGASSDNASTICELANDAAGLKMYLNETFTTLRLNDLNVWNKHLNSWPKRAPLCVHAEGQTTAAIVLLASFINRPIHICHVARKEEILIIKAAKEKGMKITCEVCPHHLFLSSSDVPKLGVKKSQMLVSPEDQQALWDNLHVIDCFATDHAPHTVEEKLSENPPPGFPGLETILPLLLNAVNEGRLTLEDVINKFHKNPRKIFSLPEQFNTYVEVDMDEEWVIPDAMPYSKAKWTPFAGKKIKGAVHRVVLRGEVAYVDGKILVQPGFGKNVREWERRHFASSHSASLNELRPSSALERAVSPLPNSLMERFDYDADGPTNEMFSRLLSADNKVHFAGDAPERNLISPIPPLRVRTESYTLHEKQKAKGDSGFLSAPTIQAEVHQHFPHGLTGKHILSVDMFTKEQLNYIFNLAQTFRMYVSKDRPLDHVLKGKLMASIFYEVSTRTCCSFSAAMQRLGGRVIYMNESTSSAQKGETLEDSIATLAGYADVVVLRHPSPGSVLKASQHCRKPVLNAGDGVGEHPSQALLDVFTIREEIGTVNGLVITLVGDLKNGRTVHSLARLLTLYNVHLRYVSPANLKMPNNITKFVAGKGIHQQEFDTLEEVLPDTDVLYVTRIQRERFESQEEYDKACGHFVVTPQLMTRAKRRMVVMHPLPRVFEISPEFDSDPRAAYFRQTECGMYVRMALLAMVLGKC